MTGTEPLFVTARTCRAAGRRSCMRRKRATARRLGASLVTADAAIREFAEATRSVRVVEI